MAFTIPIRRKIQVDIYVDRLKKIVDSMCKNEDASTPLLTNAQIREIDNLEDWTENVQSPLQHLEHKLHNWVAFLIMPLFALSNSGVAMGGSEGFDANLSLAIFTGLFAGKLIGISLFSWIGVKLGLAELPAGVRFAQITGIALLAGVGFTMSIFVANLAFFGQPELLDSAKIGILAGSLTSGLAGYLVLRLTTKKSS
jgi:NhaA family Na+:H+ antiporter